MRLRHAIIFVIACSVSAHAQLSLTPTRVFLSADQIARAAGNDNSATSLVSQALAEHIRIFPDKTTTVIGAQISEDWLPAIDGVHFQRLNDDAARSHLQQCGRVIFIQSLQLNADFATVAVAEGNRCSDSGLNLQFRHAAAGWRLERDGVHGGFASGQGECGCR